MNGGEKWEKSKKDDKVGRKKKERRKVSYKIQENFIWRGIKRARKIGVWSVKGKFLFLNRKEESFRRNIDFEDFERKSKVDGWKYRRHIYIKEYERE